MSERSQLSKTTVGNFTIECFWQYEGDMEKDMETVIMPRARQALGKVGFLLEKKIKERLNQPGTGIIYKSKYSNAKHQASAPGESPAPDGGQLKNSWQVEIEENGGANFVVKVLSTLWDKYGRRMELGGFGGGAYIAPRPYIRPVWDENVDEMQKILDLM